MLPKLLNKLGKIDIFLHDSLHTLEHILFELKIANKYIKEEGFLIADDIQHYWIKKILNELDARNYELFYDLLVIRK